MFCSLVLTCSRTSARLCVADENECLTPAARCRQICVNLPGGHRCACGPGYELDAWGRVCLDVNECHHSNGGCEHICVNTLASYHCACHDGAQLHHNQRSCVGE